MSDEAPRPLADLISRVPPLAERDPVAEAAARIAEAGGGLPVAGPDGRLVGYFSEHHLLGALFPGYIRDLRHTDFLTRDFASLLRWARRGAETTVAEHMTRDAVFLEEDDSESHAAELFLHHGMSSLPVVGPDRRIVGVVRLVDLVRSLLAACGAIPPGADAAAGGER
jgi:CBS domain-containing protein